MLDASTRIGPAKAAGRSTKRHGVDTVVEQMIVIAQEVVKSARAPHCGYPDVSLTESSGFAERMRHIERPRTKPRWNRFLPRDG